MRRIFALAVPAAWLVACSNPVESTSQGGSVDSQVQDTVGVSEVDAAAATEACVQYIETATWVPVDREREVRVSLGEGGSYIVHWDSLFVEGADREMICHVASDRRSVVAIQMDGVSQ